jgi:hypothetical protein
MLQNLFWRDYWNEVKDARAKRFFNNNMQPSLIVNDLKLGGDVSGGVALWVELGTEGHFSNLKISPIF